MYPFTVFCIYDEGPLYFHWNPGDRCCHGRAGTVSAGVPVNDPHWRPAEPPIGVLVDGPAAVQQRSTARLVLYRSAFCSLDVIGTKCRFAKRRGRRAPSRFHHFHRKSRGGIPSSPADRPVFSMQQRGFTRHPAPVRPIVCPGRRIPSETGSPVETRGSSTVTAPYGKIPPAGHRSSSSTGNRGVLPVRAGRSDHLNDSER
jgi:hypothetical protein